jgi:hypothetical protein
MTNGMKKGGDGRNSRTEGSPASRLPVSFRDLEWLSALRNNANCFLRDEKGQLRPVEPDNILVKFEGKPELDSRYARLIKLGKEATPKEWEEFFKDVNKWARESGFSFERQKIHAAVLWNYATIGQDYAKFWSDSGVTLGPEKDK